MGYFDALTKFVSGAGWMSGFSLIGQAGAPRGGPAAGQLKPTKPHFPLNLYILPDSATTLACTGLFDGLSNCVCYASEGIRQVFVSHELGLIA